MVSIASVGLATLGNLHDTADLQLSSRKEYDMALRGVNSALNNPIQASSRSFSLKDPNKMSSLMHTHGAAALLKLCGVEQLQCQGGFDMFNTLRNTVVRSEFTCWLILQLI